MQIQKAWLTTVPMFLLAVACSDARTATGPVPQSTQLEVIGVTSVSPCQEQIAALDAVTDTVTISSKNPERDRAGLVKTLTDANDLLSADKNLDAVKKLTDYIVKVEQLKAAGRIDTTTADQLIADANDAIACINESSA